jgi:leucyl/phenylalanyl-tRNA--protein transferase
VQLEPPPPIDVGQDDELAGYLAALAGVTDSLDPDLVLEGLPLGLVPMKFPPELGLSIEKVGWWSPDPRAVFRLDEIHASRSTRREFDRYEIRVDSEFDLVVEHCALLHPEMKWLDDETIDVYKRLHRNGFAHSVEVWSLDANDLCGGLYGVALGGLFSGESMFSRRPNASKVAAVALQQLLKTSGFSILDAQWASPYLLNIGAIEISSVEYLAKLNTALAQADAKFPSEIKPFQLSRDNYS